MISFLKRLVQEPGHVLRMLYRCLFCWGAPLQAGNPASAQLICAQAASARSDGGSGLTNGRLAFTVQRYQKIFGLPVCAQGEVADALSMMRVTVMARTRTQKERRAAGESYLDTHDVALDHLGCALRIGARRVIVIAYTPTHVWRCIWVYQRLGLEVIVVEDLPANAWEHGLEQWWYRSRFTLYPYELAARLWFLYRGYI